MRTCVGQDEASVITIDRTDISPQALGTENSIVTACIRFPAF